MANTYVLLASNVLSGTAASVTFSSITSTYTDLVLKVSCRASSAGQSHLILLTFNSISSGYSRAMLKGDGGSASGATASAQANIILNDFAVGDDPVTTTFSSGEIYIPNYAGAVNKQISSISVAEKNDTTAFINNISGLVANTAANSSVTFTPNASLNFLSGSSFYLYGIKNS